MGRVMLCLGRYAETPYFIERIYLNVYSVEELCYCLMKNTYLVDDGIMDGRLADWLGEECGLKDLAEELGRQKAAGATAGQYAGAILDYVGYGSREEIAQARRNIEKEAGMGVYGRKKAKADGLADSRKYVQALKAYDNLLGELPEAERELRAGILHNRGVAYVGLFQFRNAAESFRQAFACSGREESYLDYLAANRMCMAETEYLNFTAALERNYGQSLKVEKLMEEALEEFEGTQESRMLFTLKVCKEEDNTVSYYEEVERITDDLKEQYRQMAEEE